MPLLPVISEVFHRSVTVRDRYGNIIKTEEYERYGGKTGIEMLVFAPLACQSNPADIIQCDRKNVRATWGAISNTSGN
ncbi:MAG: hypothetical protein V1897_14190 [Pseudomonadota bacterium]